MTNRDKLDDQFSSRPNLFGDAYWCHRSDKDGYS